MFTENLFPIVPPVRSMRPEAISHSRRQILTTLAGVPLAGLLPSSFGFAAEKLVRHNRFPQMVQQWNVKQVRLAQRRKLEAIHKLHSKQEAEAYVESVRQRIQKCFGPEPERTPLNARVMGVVERDAYRIEKVIFESRPGFPVTANLYLPTGTTSPAPGIVGTCGHSSEGKAGESYQSFAQGLARLGYVCLIYDPIGQGERWQYLTEDLTPRLGRTVAEHLQAGNQQYLVGEFFGMWRAWDGIRALDYLMTREEVDQKHLGVTGNSGGGTMTTWLCGLDRRWTMAAPSCFVTTFLHNTENELPADTEQCPPQAIALGLDHDDFFVAMAPKPVILLGKERDFFDVRGAEESYDHLRKLYRLLGAEDQVELFVGPTTHGYSQENREAMYDWFNQVTGASEAKSEPELVIEEVETLWCTPRGQVAELPGTKTVFDFTKAASQQLRQERSAIEGNALREQVRQVLKLPPTDNASPPFRILKYLKNRLYPSPQPKAYSRAITYAVESEPDIFAMVYMLTKEPWYSRPPRLGKRATLYVSHHSSDEELRNEPLIRELLTAAPDTPFFTCDVRGIGESRPDTCGTDSFLKPYGSDYFYAAHGLMLDRPYVGQRTYDVVRVLEWLKGFGYLEVHLVAKGWGALPATFAALLSEQVSQVTLKNALTSYADIAESENYDWPLAAFVPNVLAHFDLPDCYRALDQKQLRQIEPRGAVMPS